MNLFKRLCCVLLVFALLFVPFSASAIALELDELPRIEPTDISFSLLDEDTTVNIRHYIYNETAKLTNIRQGFVIGQSYSNYSSVMFKPGTYMLDALRFDANGNTIYYKGDRVVLKITNIPFYLVDVGMPNLYYPLSNTSLLDVYHCYSVTSDGVTTHDYTDSVTLKKDIRSVGGQAFVDLELTIPYVEEDFTDLVLWIKSDFSSYSGYAGVEDVVRHFGFANSVFTSNTTVGQENTSGFFASILEWLRSIKDGITGLGDKITNVFNSITELPSKIWQFISDGLKNLFIPSENAMVSIRDNWDELMSLRFGAIYEAGSMIVDWAGNFVEKAPTDYIDLPTISVELAGEDFSFGGYKVDIVPDGFEFLVDILKGVLDVVCTLAFVNAMKKRYDEVAGGDISDN